MKDDDEITLTPYQAMEMLKICMYQHYRRYLIPGLLRSYNEMGILGALTQGKDFSQQRNLMDIVGISRAGVTLLLKEMEKKGLVVRKSDGKNKRDKTVTLAEKGRDVLAWQYDRKLRYEEVLYDGISEEERRLHAKITMKMVENIMDISERQIMTMPTYEEFDPLGKPGIPKMLYPINQKAFIKMVQRIRNIENEENEQSRAKQEGSNV